MQDILALQITNFFQNHLNHLVYGTGLSYGSPFFA